MNEVPARPVLRYHGGKMRLAPWIVSHFPDHKIYCEPYCGAASVLMRKRRCYAEVINDLSFHVVNLFQVLRDPAMSAQLEYLLRMTPFARAEFEESYLPSTDPVESARRLVIRSFMGHGSASMNVNHKTGFRNDSRKSSTAPPTDWANYPDALKAMTARLRGVCIENRYALDVIREFDGSDTLFYLDPPYVQSSRSFKTSPSGQVYEHEMVDDNHREMAEMVRCVKGMVVLSGYANEVYDKELFHDWHRFEKPAHIDGAGKRVEVLWLNDRARNGLQGVLF